MGRLLYQAGCVPPTLQYIVASKYSAKCVQGGFVAAFAQSNEGDVSPNTKGAKCIDTGKPCDFNSSTCNGKVGPTMQLGSSVCTLFRPPPFQNELCVAAGPGKDMFDSTMIIAEKQYTAGKVSSEAVNSD